MPELNHFHSFFSYFRSVWGDSSENHWYEGSHPFATSNNQGMEAKNKCIKQSHTFRKRMALGPFINTCLRMVHEWALKDFSNLDSTRNETLFAQPDGLKLRSAGYDWLGQHKSNTNFVKRRSYPILRQSGQNHQVLPKISSFMC